MTVHSAAIAAYRAAREAFPWERAAEVFRANKWKFDDTRADDMTADRLRAVVNRLFARMEQERAGKPACHSTARFAVLVTGDDPPQVEIYCQAVHGRSYERDARKKLKPASSKGKTMKQDPNTTDPLYPRWKGGLEHLEPHYSRHVGAMTRERLHAKSEIAVQLAWRDLRLTEVEADKIVLYRNMVRSQERLEKLLAAVKSYIELDAVKQRLGGLEADALGLEQLVRVYGETGSI